MKTRSEVVAMVRAKIRLLHFAYSTHSRESIEALRILMGHSSIETTAGYKHPVVEAATNPLDDLAG